MAEEELATFGETASGRSTKNEGEDVIDEKKLLRKLDRHLVPYLTLLFLLSFMDRTNSNSFSFLIYLSLIFLQSETLVSKVWSQTYT